MQSKITATNPLTSTGTKTLLEHTVDELLVKLDKAKKLQLDYSSKEEYNMALVYFKEVENIESELSLLQAAFPRAYEMIAKALPNEEE